MDVNYQRISFLSVMACDKKKGEMIPWLKWYIRKIDTKDIIYVEHGVKNYLKLTKSKFSYNNQIIFEFINNNLPESSGAYHI